MAKGSAKFKAKQQMLIGIMLGLVLMSSAALFTVSAKRAEAFPGEALAAAVWKEAKEQIRSIKNRITTLAQVAYKQSKDVVFKNALRIYLTKVAEDTATYIATGSPGQKPLFLTQPGKYFEDIGDAALGDYLDTLSTQALGKSLCDLGPVTYKINLSLRNELNPNYCTDGCQRTYETNLQTIEPHIRARDAVQKSLNTFRLPILQKAARECPKYTDEGSCNAYREAGLQYCEWYGPPSTETGCFPNQFVTRPMTEADMSGTSQSNFSIADIQAVLQICKGGVATTQTDLASCYEDLAAYVETNQQKWSGDLKLCKNRCTGERRTAKCTLTQIGENVTKLYEDSSFSASAGINIFKTGDTGPGRFLKQWEAARNASTAATQSEKTTLELGGVGPVRSTITGEITSPDTFTSEAAKKAVEGAGKEQEIYTGSPLADAIGIFKDTLTKKLIERIFNRETGGIAPDSTKGKVLLGSSGFAGGGYNSGGITAIRAQFAQSFAPSLTSESNVNVDTVTQLENEGVIDKDFADAIRQNLTLEEAIKKNLIHGDWWFGYTDQKQQPKVGNGGYPADSFAVLRKYRIIPASWEVVAEYIKNVDVTRSFTMSDMIAKFSDEICPSKGSSSECEASATCAWKAGANCGAQTSEGTCASTSGCLWSTSGGVSFCASANTCVSSYAGMIDPKWVLKAPLAVCAKQGFGEQLIDGSCQVSEVAQILNDDNNACTSGEHDTNGDGKCNTDDPAVFENACERSQICVDDQSCVRESPDGKSCLEYGYCAKEKPIWRFAGEACSEQFASCQGYITTSNETVSYLTNSVEKNGCSADNVGCNWYCQEADATGTFQCTSNAGPKMYFDKDAQTCDATNAGCSTMLRMVEGANIFPNSNFDYSTLISPDQQADFAGWQIGGNSQTCGAQGYIDGFASSGSAAMRLQQLDACAGGNQFAQASVPTGLALGGRTFTVSFTARATNPAATFTVNIGSDPIIAGQSFSFDVNSVYQRFAATVNFDPSVTATNVVVRINTLDNNPIIIDQIMLAEANTPGAYQDYGDSAINIKVPPKNVTCTGSATDPASCSQFTHACLADDVGCNAYRPIEGGVTIPGKVTNPASCDFSNPSSCDQCPAAFLGCKAVRELALTNAIPDPTFAARLQQEVSVVPESGVKCEAQFVGCEEYTNLDLVAQGGEGREYYSKLQQCVEPDDPQLRFYFSWVGSASTGYELKRWELKKSNLGEAPCTHLAVTGQKNEACVDTAANVQSCQASWPGDPNCVQFFDDFGGTWYRYLDQTIIGSESCHPYRNTLDSKTYYFDSTKSAGCPAEFAGCREFKGPGANNTQTLISSSFESTQDPSDGWSNGTVTTESTSFGGHSLSINTIGATKQVATFSTKAYILSFWAKGNAGAQLASQVGGVNSPVVTLTTDWQLYRVGPIYPTTNATSGVSVGCLFASCFVDNITLQSTNDNLFIVHESASSCSGFENCSEYADRSNNRQFLKSFSRLCQDNAVGCEAVIDTHNSTTPLATTLANEQGYLQEDGTIFSNSVPADSVRFLVNDPKKYCSSDAKGCMAMGLPTLDVAREVKSFQTTFIRNNPDTFSTSLCSSNELFCSEFREIENESSVAYFKDPGARTCEYRQGNASAGSASGWYIKGSNTPCPADNSWGKTCPVEQSTCREFKSPRVYANPASPGQSSYYYLNKSLSKSQCQQGVDPANNCLGFLDPASGNPNSRPKLDVNDPSKVISQICQQCSDDTNICGRNGNPACCTWDSSYCAIDKAQGLDELAPHYCLYERTASDFDGDGTAANPGCTVNLGDAFAVPNSYDLDLASNCDSGGVRTGKPQCFLPDLSDYDPAKRWCGDFACNVNTVLPVDADRKCEQWLACTNEQTITTNGVSTTVCLERALRDTNGFINSNAKENVEQNLVYDLTKGAPDNVRDLSNYSGMVKAGVKFPNGRLIDGFFPYGRMTEQGTSGAFISIPDFNFETNKIAASESPVAIVGSAPGGRPWLDKASFLWQATVDSANKETAQLTLEKTDTASQFSNQFLSVSPLLHGGTTTTGAFVLLDEPEQITTPSPGPQAQNDYYMISFKAKKKGVLANGIKINVWELKPNKKPLYESDPSKLIILTDDWQNYVVKLSRYKAQTVDTTGTLSIGLFFEVANNVAGDSFQIDDISLKPALVTKTIEPGSTDLVFASRQCRSYPQSNSLVCDYTDTQSNVVYNGLKGYCVEKDPRNANVCLTWWPIDSLQGEKNIFAASEKSLTRTPLYYCAETKKKDPPIKLPRYVCLTSYRDESGEANGLHYDRYNLGERCDTLAIVDNLLPAGYNLAPANAEGEANWLYGSGSEPQDGCNINPGNDTPNCCTLKQFNGAACTSVELLRFNGSNTFTVQSQQTLDNCLNELKKYYGEVQIRDFIDDGSGFGGGCGRDNSGDTQDFCTNSTSEGKPNDCEYAQVYPSYLTSAGAVDSDPNTIFYTDPFWLSRAFPRQCKTLIQVTSATGDSKPWTSRLQNGLYTVSPINVVQQTQCAPYGGSPVFASPTDIVNCVPDPTNPPLNGCTVLGNICTKVNSNETGECVLAPMELYSPNNPDNFSVQNLCSETRLAGGYYNCGDEGVCPTCRGGDRAGLQCNTSTDCPNGSCVTTSVTCAGAAPGSCTVIPYNCEGGTRNGQSCSGATNFNLCVTGGGICPFIRNEPASYGISRLQLLFTKSFGTWSWDSARRMYKKEPTASDLVSPTRLCPATMNSHADQPNNFCAFRPQVTNVKANSATGGDVIVSGQNPGGNRSISIAFDALVDPEQSPLAFLNIDWGDSVPIAGYKQGAINKIYHCNSANGRDCDSVCPGNGTPVDNMTDPSGERHRACVYDNYPRVQVHDNWDWCNSSLVGDTTRCSTDTDNWANFPGRIIVFP